MPSSASRSSSTFSSGARSRLPLSLRHHVCAVGVVAGHLGAARLPWRLLWLQEEAYRLPSAHRPNTRSARAGLVRPLFSIVVGGVLPFGAVFIELFFILSSIWLHQFYYVFGFLLLVLLILVITCAEISIVMCYFQLCARLPLVVARLPHLRILGWLHVRILDLLLLHELEITNPSPSSSTLSTCGSSPSCSSSTERSASTPALVRLQNVATSRWTGCP